MSTSQDESVSGLIIDCETADNVLATPKASSQQPPVTDAKQSPGKVSSGGKRRGRPPGSVNKTPKTPKSPNMAKMTAGVKAPPKSVVKTEAAGDTSQSTTNSSPIKKSHKKAKKDKNAPNKPPNGYVMYLTRNRDRVRAANPGKGFPEVTQMLAIEWNALTEDQRKPFLEEAAAKKAKYEEELAVYQKSDQYKEFKAIQDKMAKQKVKEDKKLKSKVSKIDKKRESTASSSKSPNKSLSLLKPSTSTGNKANKSKAQIVAKVPTVAKTKATVVVNGNGHLPPRVSSASGETIPIFTEVFLDHNKSRESELRKLRKVTNEYEEQNAILSTHIENMKAAEIKLKAEMTQMRQKNREVGDHLEQLKVQFVKQFSNIAIPGTNEYPTMATVESYISKLHDKIMEQKHKGNKENEVIQETLHKFVTAMADS